MPRYEDICGIYGIKTPNGSLYIGSSIGIRRRWAEHRSMLRHNRHHSMRLQAAYDKHKDNLLFFIIEIGSRDNIADREQYFIDAMKPRLNTSTSVRNSRIAPETQKKLRKYYDDPAWCARQSEISRNIVSRWIPVECEDGRIFKNTADAARAFGLNNSSMKYLAENQNCSKFGLRFRLAGRDWRPEESLAEKSWRTRRSNGTDKMKAETKERIRQANAGRKPPILAAVNAIKYNSKPVMGINTANGTEIRFPSAKCAAIAIRPLGWKTAKAQITKATTGVKKTAYGYIWRKETAVYA